MFIVVLSALRLLTVSNRALSRASLNEAKSPKDSARKLWWTEECNPGEVDANLGISKQLII